MTLYFYRLNLIGIHESSDKAVKIMLATTVMAVIMLAWCALTLALEARHDLTKSQLGCVRKDYSVIYEVALSSSRLVCRRNCPQAASMS